MKQNDSFCWLKRTGEELEEDIWSSLEERWIPGKGICKVVSLSNGIVTYTVENHGPYSVRLKEAIIPYSNLHYPIDYAYPSILK